MCEYFRKKSSIFQHYICVFLENNVLVCIESILTFSMNKESLYRIYSFSDKTLVSFASKALELNFYFIHNRFLYYENI